MGRGRAGGQAAAARKRARRKVWAAEAERARSGAGGGSGAGGATGRRAGRGGRPGGTVPGGSGRGAGAALPAAPPRLLRPSGPGPGGRGLGQGEVLCRGRVVPRPRAAPAGWGREGGVAGRGGSGRGRYRGSVPAGALRRDGFEQRSTGPRMGVRRERGERDVEVGPQENLVP